MTMIESTRVTPEKNHNSSMFDGIFGKSCYRVILLKLRFFSTAKNVNDEEKKAFNALKRASKELFAICYSC